jgi:hypothetical protein
MQNRRFMSIFTVNNLDAVLIQQTTGTIHDLGVCVWQLRSQYELPSKFPYAGSNPATRSQPNGGR